MNKVKFLVIAIIGLLISNIVLFIIITKEYQRKAPPKTFIINKLGFDKQQISNYEVYIRKHQKAITDNENKMNELRANLFSQLKYEQNKPKIDSLISGIAKQQYWAEYINYNHFLEIKSLCKPSQQKDFKELTHEIAALFSLEERK